MRLKDDFFSDDYEKLLPANMLLKKGCQWTQSILASFPSSQNPHCLKHRRPWVFLSTLILIFLSSCSLKHPDIRPSDLSLASRTVALISTPSYEEAILVSKTLRQGGLLPKSARSVSLKQLDQISPLIAKHALPLKPCEVSLPLKNPSGTGYLIIMLKNNSNKPCSKPKKPFSDSLKNFSDAAGQIMIGLLLVGGTVFLAALPFLF